MRVPRTLGAKTHEKIAITGMACRFPGNSNTPDSFWNMLCSGYDAMSANPPAWRRDLGGGGGFLSEETITTFDPKAFGLSPNEAQEMDPQQRLLLQTAREALEDSGMLQNDGSVIDNEMVGVYLGMMNFDYSAKAIDSESPIAANRISYIFNLRGPCFAVDTACSSSLVAMHR
eukprot:GSMAST32.ASY1.ANO1.2510.1 assembled CDS